MPAGKFRERITIEKPDPDAIGNAHGEVDLTDDANWITVGQRWAAFSDQGSREYEQARQTFGELTHLVRVRHDSLTALIDGTYRVRHDRTGKRLQILSARNAGLRNIEVALVCKETR